MNPSIGAISKMEIFTSTETIVKNRGFMSYDRKYKQTDTRKDIILLYKYRDMVKIKTLKKD